MNVVRIDVPPLRKRPEDIPLLAHFFLEKFKTRFQKMNLALDQQVLTLIQSYEWPGNVRELENLMQHLVVVSDGAVIRPESLPEKMRNVPRLPETRTMFFSRRIFPVPEKCI